MKKISVVLALIGIVLFFGSCSFEKEATGSIALNLPIAESRLLGNDANLYVVSLRQYSVDDAQKTDTASEKPQLYEITAGGNQTISGINPGFYQISLVAYVVANGEKNILGSGVRRRNDNSNNSDVDFIKIEAGKNTPVAFDMEYVASVKIDFTLDGKPYTDNSNVTIEIVDTSINNFFGYKPDSFEYPYLGSDVFIFKGVGSKPVECSLTIKWGENNGYLHDEKNVSLEAGKTVSIHVEHNSEGSDPIVEVKTFSLCDSNGRKISDYDELQDAVNYAIEQFPNLNNTTIFVNKDVTLENAINFNKFTTTTATTATTDQLHLIISSVREGDTYKNVAITANNSQHFSVGNSGAGKWISIELIGLTLCNGTSSKKGGAISFYGADDAIFTATNCVFSNNKTSTTDNGGGMFYSNNVVATFDNCEFSNNSAEQADGGAIYADLSRLYIRSCTFTKNSATRGGGAIYVNNSDFTVESIVESNGNLFADNIATGYNDSGYNDYCFGGAIKINNTDKNCTATISKATFEGNEAKLGGGAICVQYGSLELASSTFSKERCNKAENGGTIYLGGGGGTGNNGSCLLTIRDDKDASCTIYGTASSKNGNAIYVNLGSTITIENEQTATHDIDPDGIYYTSSTTAGNVVVSNRNFTYALTNADGKEIAVSAVSAGSKISFIVKENDEEVTDVSKTIALYQGDDEITVSEQNKLVSIPEDLVGNYTIKVTAIIDGITYDYEFSGTIVQLAAN